MGLNLSVLSPGLLAEGSSAVAGRLCEQPTMNISPQAVPRCLIQETLNMHPAGCRSAQCRPKTLQHILHLVKSGKPFRIRGFWRVTAENKIFKDAEKKVENAIMEMINLSI